MANEIVRFTTGPQANLDSTAKLAGVVRFAVDSNNSTGTIYFDKDATHRIKMGGGIDSLTINGELVGSVDLSNTRTGVINVRRNTFLIGTGTAAGTWKATIPPGTGITELYDGFAIDYWINIAGSSSGTTLNLTLSNGATTGALPVYYQGTSRLTQKEYAVNNIIHLVYRKYTYNGTAYEGWWCYGNYDTDTHDRLLYGQIVKANSSEAITAKSIICGTDAGYRQLLSGVVFNITYPILYADAAISVSGTSQNTYLVFPVVITTTQNLTLTAYRPVYIKGKLIGTLFTPISTTPLTQTEPTSEDGYDYIFLGMAYSATGMYLLPEHKIFRYINGKFQEDILVAQLAVYDSSGQKIVSTYIRNLEYKNNSIVATKGDGSTSSINVAVTDENVISELANTTKAYLTGTTSTTGAATHLKYDQNVYLDTVAGLIVATNFKGSLIGNADTATKATNDSSGQKITSTYIKGLTFTGNDTKDADGTTSIAAGSKAFANIVHGDGGTEKQPLPVHANGVAGVVTSTAQTIYGAKTFNSVITVLGNQYIDTALSGAINMNNSDLYKVNSIKFADLSDTAAEGLQWYRDDTHTDSLWVSNGVIKFTPNREWGKTGVDYTVIHTGNYRDYIPFPYWNSTTDRIQSTDTFYAPKTGGTSSLQYLKSGGSNNAAPVWLSPKDLTADGALVSTDSMLVTARGVYYSLAKINNADQTHATAIYAPTTGGTTNYWLVATNATSAPTWKDPSTLTVGRATADSAGRKIDTTYIRDITVSDTNHKLTFTTGDGGTVDRSLPFVKLSGDTMTGNLTVNSKVTTTGNSKSISLYASTNRGVYDDTNAEWLVYRAENGNTAYIVNKGKVWTFDSTGNLTTPGGAGNTANLIGTATRALNDGAGLLITGYLRTANISGKTLTFTTGAGATTNLTIGLSTMTELLKPISTTTTASASTWNIPSGSYQVWGERFSDTRLQYTPSGGTPTTITDTGDWTMWLTGAAASNTATLNMRIDGDWYATTFRGALVGNVTGNASTATTWLTARTFTVKDHDKGHSGPGSSVNGSTNVELMMPAIINARLFIALAGESGSTMAILSSGDLIFTLSDTNTREIRWQVGTNDYARIAAGATASNAGWLELATGDETNEPIYVRQYSGAFTTVSRTLTLLDANGHTTFPGDLKVTTNNTLSLGASGMRWKALFIGSADSYGGNLRHIYWSNGIPVLSTATSGSVRQAIYLNAGTMTPTNFFVSHFGNAGNSNMNDVARKHASSGMTNLTDPGNTTDNPMTGTTLSTGWHLYWDTNYTDDPSGTNPWVAQIVNKAGTTQWWVRSKAGGGAITNGTAWAAPWRYLVTSAVSGLGSATKGVYINANGEAVATNYDLNSNVQAGTTPRMAWYSNATTVAATPKIEYINDTPVTGHSGLIQTGLRILGTAYGEAANLLSGSEGQMSYGDAGPLIQFTSSNQSGAIIANHYDSTSGAGFSFNFVSNQSTTAVKSTHAVFTQRLAVGQTKTHDTYPLYVNGRAAITGMLYINNTAGAGEGGIELYSTSMTNGHPTYGLTFATTANLGTFGDVLSDWATYFTVTAGGVQRGWIFKGPYSGSDKKAGNVASVSARGHFTGTLEPSSWYNGQSLTNAAYNIANYANKNSYNPWMRATNTWAAGEEDAKTGRWFSFGTLGTRFYWGGSPTTKTSADNSFTNSFYYDIDTGILNGKTSQFTNGQFTYLSAGGAVDTNYIFRSYGRSWIQGPLLVGYTDTAAFTGYATANTGLSNYIAFYGVYGDNPASFNHTYIGERIYGAKTQANELSELLIFHGNDVGATNELVLSTASGSGPDRIRMLAHQFLVDVTTAALSGTWTDVGNSTARESAFIVNRTSGITLGNAVNAARSGGLNQITVQGHMVINGAYNTQNSYSEGLRINQSSNGWAVLTLGGANGSVTGTGNGIWLVGSNGRNFYIRENGSSSDTIMGIHGDGTSAGFSVWNRLYVNSALDTSYNFKVGGTSYFTDHAIFYTQLNGATAYRDGSAIQIRESNLVTTNLSAWAYAPKLGFHWGGRYQGTIGLHSNGAFYFSLSSGLGNASLYSGHHYPTTDNTYDLGSNALRWRTGYFRNIDMANIDTNAASSPTGTITWSGGTDAADIYYKLDAADAGRLVFNMRDDTNALTAFAYNGTQTIYVNPSTPSIYPNNDKTGSLGLSGNRWNTAYIASVYGALAPVRTISGATHAEALLNEFNANKANIMRNLLVTYYSSAYSNGSQYMGYFLSGYDSNPYGGFYVAHYDKAYYVGISNGTYALHEIITNNQVQNFSANKTWGTSGAGGILNGAATNGGINSICIGDDVWLGDCNVGGMMGMKSTGNNTGFYFYNSAGTATGLLYSVNGTYLNTNIPFYSPDVRGNRVRLYDNWVGFYLTANAAGSRYGYIQTNENRMYFRKENGVNGYAFDFSGGAITTNSNGIVANHGHDFIVAGNEFNFIPDNYNNTVWFNYLTFNRNTSGNLTAYIFGNGKTGELARITSGAFSGSAATLRDRNNGTVTYSNYSSAGMAAGDITWLTCWNGYELRAIHKNLLMSLILGGGGASPNAGTINRMAYYSAANAISSATNVSVLNNFQLSSSRNGATVDIRANGLRIWGATYGNTANLMVSNTAGVFRFSDGGPQIVFNTTDTWNALAGALIFTDHDAAASGASFHFVTTEGSDNNGGNLTVTAPRFRARKGLTVGQNSDNTSYTLVVNGTGYFANAITLVNNNNGHVISAHTGSSWIAARNTALVIHNTSVASSSYSPIFSSKTLAGSWSMGPCHPSNNIYLSYATDTNFNAGTNSTMNSIYGTPEGYWYAARVYNAVWNDYAEHRKTVKDVQLGQVVAENGDGEQHITKHRLEMGCNITSDTYGTSMNETPDSQTPIAVAGRVLAYVDGDRDNYKPGDAVCSGPDGTVSKMSRREIRRYPDAIVGYVSEVPDYEIWHAGDPENGVATDIKVDGRIWIKVN